MHHFCAEGTDEPFDFEDPALGKTTKVQMVLVRDADLPEREINPDRDGRQRGA